MEKGTTNHLIVKITETVLPVTEIKLPLMA
jgi:hypothetical protein